jgi:hypothetical protein
MTTMTNKNCGDLASLATETNEEVTVYGAKPRVVAAIVVPVERARLVAAFQEGDMNDREDGRAASAQEELPADKIPKFSIAAKESKLTTAPDGRQESRLARIPPIPAISKNATGSISSTLWSQLEDDTDEIRNLLRRHESVGPIRSLDLNFESDEGKTTRLQEEVVAAETAGEAVWIAAQENAARVKAAAVAREAEVARIAAKERTAQFTVEKQAEAVAEAARIAAEEKAAGLKAEKEELMAVIARVTARVVAKVPTEEKAALLKAEEEVMAAAAVAFDVKVIQTPRSLFH